MDYRLDGIPESGFLIGDRLKGTDLFNGDDFKVVPVK